VGELEAFALGEVVKALSLGALEIASLDTDGAFEAFVLGEVEAVTLGSGVTQLSVPPKQAQQASFAV
jgi:hypothetical protein